MRTKIYYIFLLTMFFLMSCGENKNVSEPVKIGTLNGVPIIIVTVDGHDYINISREYTHAGTCKKCKSERDSIINVIIKEIRKNE